MTTAPSVPQLKVALIGDGIGPSLTPIMHMVEGAAHGLDYQYHIWDLLELGLPGSAIGDLISKARREGYAGVNVTHPCKQLVLEHIDEIDEDARRLGAVNTVVFRDGSSYGYNTDFSGFYAGFQVGLPDVAAAAGVLKVTQIGAGGAGSAITYALLQSGVSDLTVCELDPARAKKFVSQFQALFPSASIRVADDVALALAVAEADGVINVTPMGMKQHPGTAFDTSLLRPTQFVADIVYRPLRTQLLKDAELIGCQTLDGGRMAVNQAVDAFTLFTGVAANPDRMRAHFLNLISAEIETAVRA